MSNEIVVNNLLIKYTQAGESGGKTLLFLHGWRSQAAVWRPVVESLKLSSYQVIAVNLPGFGGSQKPSREFGVGEYAEVVKGFIEKMELKNVIIVGHSFGGRVGIKLAAEYPSEIAKLVLVDSAGFVMETSKKNIYSSVAKIARPFFKPNFMHSLRKKIYKAIGAEDYVATPELQSTFVKVTGEDLTEDMKKITCPTLIVYGENDKDTPVEFGKKMLSLINNYTPSSDGVTLSNYRAKLKIIPNAGHFSFLDQQEDFIRLIQDFIV